MDNWTNVSTSIFRFSYGGSTSDTGQENNGVNIVYFGDSPGSTLGDARFWFDASGSITDCDIIIEENNSWTSSFLEDLATHEFGHCVPLGHVTTDATMNPNVQDGASNLAQDDIDGLAFLYPSVTDIPTINEWGMIIFFIFSSGLAVYNLRKKNSLQ